MAFSSVNVIGGFLGKPASSRFFCMNADTGATHPIEIRASATGLA